MQAECLICKAPLEYLQEDVLTACAVCHKEEMTKTRCVQGHYVCNDCHMAGMDSILGLCLAARSEDPIEILEEMMSMPFCHMHGPEHHVMVGAALLTAYHNAGGAVQLPQALSEIYSRGKQVPGGSCGFWGACGAGVSAGMYMSIVTGATPLADRSWGLSNQMTARALARIGEAGGPRCCKRDAYFAIMEAVRFTREALGVSMALSGPLCTRFRQNRHCLRSRCPFYGGDEAEHV